MSFLEKLKAKQPKAQEQPEPKRPAPAQQQVELQGRSKKPSGRHVTRGLVQNWKAARPWLLNHIEKLQAEGWTRQQIFQAGRFTYPHGPWGVAWASAWRKPGVEVQIDKGGAIRWTWQEVGREITQASYPNKKL